MQRNINSLIGFKMGATDGEIGKVKEFYFDDHTWTVRYLIIETGNWLLGRKVLIAPQALLNPDWENKVFPVNLTKAQIENSPDIDTDMPVSRSQEIELYGHYPWQNYWGTGFFAGGFGGYPDATPFLDETSIEESESKDHSSDSDPHLRSSHNIIGYQIHASDGDFGHVIDFIVDDQNWELKYLVIDTHQWIGGKKVLIPVGHIISFQWDSANVYVNETVDSVNHSLSFNESEFNRIGFEQYSL
jgi:uncharacterized protein YrrD